MNTNNTCFILQLLCKIFVLSKKKLYQNPKLQAVLPAMSTDQLVLPTAGTAQQPGWALSHP